MATEKRLKLKFDKSATDNTTVYSKNFTNMTNDSVTKASMTLAMDSNDLTNVAKDSAAEATMTSAVHSNDPIEMFKDSAISTKPSRPNPKVD